MIKVIIVEDEIAGQLLLKTFIEKNFPNLTIVCIKDNVTDAILEIEKHKPDLVYLDIQIKGGTSFDILSHFNERTFEVVFTTAYDRYAIQAIKQQAVDYILKPIKIDEFMAGTNSAISRFYNEKGNNDLKHLNVVTNNTVQVINFEDIYYLKADGSYTEIIYKEGKSISSKNIGEHETILLPTNSFFRIHHSYIVNKNQIKKIEKGRNGAITLLNNEVIPISQRKIKDFMAFLQLKE